MLFPFGKKISFYAKSVSFWVNEWIFKYSDKIMPCKLWSKVTRVFLNINFCAKMFILGKKLKFCEKCWLFKTIVHYYWKWISYWKTFLFSENYDCRILIKTSIFFRKCLFVHVFIFIKVFYLLENCYFDSKYHFIWWYFGQKCHFPSRIYISGGIHSLDKLSNFLSKRSQSWKNDNWL